jgi:hypothetical protein
VTCTATAKGLSLHFGQRVGSYAPWWKSISVTVHGARAVTMTIPDQPNAATVEISG